MDPETWLPLATGTIWCYPGTHESRCDCSLQVVIRSPIPTRPWRFFGCHIWGLFCVTMHVWNVMTNKPHMDYIVQSPFSPHLEASQREPQDNEGNSTFFEIFFFSCCVFFFCFKPRFLVKTSHPEITQLIEERKEKGREPPNQQNQTKHQIIQYGQRKRPAWHFLLHASWAGVGIKGNTKARFCALANSRKLSSGHCRLAFLHTYAASDAGRTLSPSPVE